MKQFFNIVLSFFFPEECFGCGKNNELICPDCLKKIPYSDSNDPNILAAVSYKDAIIKKTIRALKFRKAKNLAEPLAELIYQRLFKEARSPLGGRASKYLLVPIPLSKKRQKERSFNQAESITKHLSDKLSVKIETNVLYKNKDTLSQVEIKEREKRLNNMKNVFSVKNPELIKNKIVLVVDDVSTTGATINEARRALCMAGAKKAIGIVVAK